MYLIYAGTYINKPKCQSEVFHAYGFPDRDSRKLSPFCDNNEVSRCQSRIEWTKLSPMPSRQEAPRGGKVWYRMRIGTVTTLNRDKVAENTHPATTYLIVGTTHTRCLFSSCVRQRTSKSGSSARIRKNLEARETPYDPTYL